MQLNKLVAISMVAYCVTIGNGFSAGIGAEFDAINAEVARVRRLSVNLEREKGELERQVAERPTRQDFIDFSDFLIGGDAAALVSGQTLTRSNARYYVKNLFKPEGARAELRGFRPYLDVFREPDRVAFGSCVLSIARQKGIEIPDVVVVATAIGLDPAQFVPHLPGARVPAGPGDIREKGGEVDPSGRPGSAAGGPGDGHS